MLTLQNFPTLLAISFFIIIIIFSTITITYKSNMKHNNVPIDFIDERNSRGLQDGINPNIINKNDNLYSEDSENDNIDSENDNEDSENDKSVNAYNPNASKNELWGLPDKDNYMTYAFREQIDNLQDRYYNDIGNFSNI